MHRKTLGISALLYLGGIAVFVFGNPYFRVFPTNWNFEYYIALVVIFFGLRVVFKKNEVLLPFLPAADALLMASTALLFLKTGILDLPKNHADPLQSLTLDKLSQFLHVVPVSIGMTLVARERLSSIFIKKGHLKFGLTFGLISFACFSVLAIITQWGAPNRIASLPAALPWILIFVLANATMEELWLRAIFLKKYQPLIGN